MLKGRGTKLNVNFPKKLTLTSGAVAGWGPKVNVNFPKVNVNF